jgi:hypothetical protein
VASRLTLDKITDATAHLPEPERSEARILLACKLIRQEVRGIRRDLGIPASGS